MAFLVRCSCTRPKRVDFEPNPMRHGAIVRCPECRLLLYAWPVAPGMLGLTEEVSPADGIEGRVPA